MAISAVSAVPGARASAVPPSSAANHRPSPTTIVMAASHRHTTPAATAEQPLRRQMLSLSLGILTGGLLSGSDASAVECSMMGPVPCMPPPPNGEPRYKTFDGPAYDPAKEAEKRFKAKFAEEKLKSDNKAKAALAPPPPHSTTE